VSKPQLTMTRLQTALTAAKELIRWYENDHERYSYDEADVPEELLELEEAYNAAMKELGDHA
jgi:hypothetical protein